MRFPWIALATVLLLLVAAEVPAQAVSDNPLKPLDRPYEYVNAEAEFRCTWPRGCDKLRRRSNELDPEADPFTALQVHHVSCDRDGEEGEGCSVSAIFNQLSMDGHQAGPAEVVDRIEEQLQRFRATVLEQTPIQNELPGGRRIEGLDIKARDEHGVGELWLRGVLSNGDIYVISAWNMAGGLFEDPEYVEFMNSFLPGTE